MSTRRFKLNTHLTMPLDLHPAPGARHHRAEPSHIIELDVERCKSHDRFIRGRIRAGDLTELDPEPVRQPAPAPQLAPAAPAPVKE